MRIGFIGYSAQRFNEVKARMIIADIFEKELQVNPGFSVVSGGTNMGIPKLVYQEADKYGLHKVGVICEEGKKYELYKPLDLIITEGQHWGDESKKFLSLIDKLYKIGGGKQSEAEAKIAEESGMPVVEIDLPAID